MNLRNACQLALGFLTKAETVLENSPLAGEAELVRKSLAAALEEEKSAAMFEGKPNASGGDWRKKTPNYTVIREGLGVHVLVRDGFDIKDQLKEANFKWDGEKRVWRTREPISSEELEELVQLTGMAASGGEGIQELEIPL
ncbi:MAG: hypothetical protein WCO14_01325 [bacterium]